MATRKFKITYMAHIIFLLDGTVLKPQKGKETVEEPYQIPKNRWLRSEIRHNYSKSTGEN